MRPGYFRRVAPHAGRGRTSDPVARQGTAKLVDFAAPSGFEMNMALRQGLWILLVFLLLAVWIVVTAKPSGGTVEGSLIDKVQVC